MAKRINILGAGSTVPFADGGLKLSKSIKLSEIEPHPDFQSLFKIDDVLLNRIADSISKKGFDASQPVHIWILTDDDGTVHKYLIDGYTRIAALKLAGHETVPYFEHKFETFDEAYKYVLSLQVNRRNLDSSELLKNVSRLMGSEFIQNAEGKKSEVIGEILGVSGRTVEKTISVLENADEETLAKIESRELSVNKAYKQGKEKAKEKTLPKVFNNDADLDPLNESENSFFQESEEISDALEDTEGNPQSVTVRSRDMSEHFVTPEESISDLRLIERYKEGFVDGFKKAVSELSYTVYDKICSLIENGRTLTEIQNDDTFSDFSFSVFAPKIGIPANHEQILKEYNK